MFIVITHHFCKPGQVETARGRIDKSGGGMTGEPGFKFRYRIESPGSPGVVSTLTAWNSEADHQAYRGKRNYGSMADSPYERVEHHSYEVQSELVAK
jgi:heme-degrading monooxygenase HmoA